MTDREKILRGAECCKGEPSANGCPKECPYLPKRHLTCGLDPFLDDVIALLKEQEPIVRCKDCKHCEYPNAEREWCKKGHLHGNAETWFCADGERR